MKFSCILVLLFTGNIIFSTNAVARKGVLRVLHLFEICLYPKYLAVGFCGCHQLSPTIPGSPCPAQACVLATVVSLLVVLSGSLHMARQDVKVGGIVPPPPTEKNGGGHFRSDGGFSHKNFRGKQGSHQDGKFGGDCPSLLKKIWGNFKLRGGFLHKIFLEKVNASRY